MLHRMRKQIRTRSAFCSFRASGVQKYLKEKGQIRTSGPDLPFLCMYGSQQFYSV